MQHSIAVPKSICRTAAIAPASMEDHLKLIGAVGGMTLMSKNSLETIERLERLAARHRINADRAAGVTSLVLEPTDGQPLAAALRGQFIVLRLRSAPGAPALLRSYSLSGEPRDDRYRLNPTAGPGPTSRLRFGLATFWRKRATRQLHAEARRWHRHLAECWRRCNPGARHAPCIGRWGPWCPLHGAV
jgi:hypothetical protein